LHYYFNISIFSIQCSCMSNRCYYNPIIALLGALFLATTVNAQNLVPNASFEQHNSCPTANGQMQRCIGWRTYTLASPDYFNVCATNSTVSVPTNFPGTQSPANGQAYAGLIDYDPGNYREYIATSISPMQIGTLYEVSMFVSLGDGSRWGSNGLGMYLYDSGQIVVATQYILPVTAQILYDNYGPITNKNGWTKLTKFYVADSAYDNIVIGGFKDNNSIEVDSAGPSGGYAYYYIDSVTIQPSDTICISFSNTLLCSRDTITVSYLAANKFLTSGNFFKLQLSDSSGSFSNPVNIGSASSPTSSGYITGVIPISVLPGNNYRIRVQSNSPLFNSANNGQPISIGAVVPAKPVITSNSPLCTNDSLNLSATSTTSGVNYKWTGPNSFSSNLQYPFIANSTTSTSGQYIVAAYLYGCKSKDTVNVLVNSYPTNVVASSNSPICAGDSLKFYSSSSTSGVSYSWAGPAGFSSSLQNPFRVNTTLAMSGNYIDTVSINGCKIIDTVAVVVKPFPNAPTAANNGPLCTNATLNLSAVTTNGVNYSWTGPNGFNSSAQNPIRLFMTTADSGNYIVIADLNGCKLKDSTHVTVYPTTPMPIANANTPVCLGAVLNLSATTVPSAIYNWTGPNNFFSTQQNPVKTNIISANAGTYWVTAKVNGCASQPDSVTITTIQGPSVSVYASPDDTICAGTNGALVSIPFGIGLLGANYQWYKNGSLAGVTTSNYIVPGALNGDKFYVEMQAVNSVCNSPVQSNTVTLTVLPATPPPAATITATPGTDIWPYLNVSFSIGSLANGGAAPSYQWKLNNKDIVGATANKWSTTELKDGDSVCLLVTSSDQCATPKSALSNCLKMKVPTGVPLNPLGGDLRLYPNPVSKQLTIENATVGTTIQVNNIVGQTIYRGTIQSAKETINTSQWVPGTYLLHLVDNNGNRVTRKVVKE
jgi:hypothetical protein